MIWLCLIFKLTYGQQIVIGDASGNGLIQVFNENFTQVNSFQAHTDTITRIKLLPNGCVATASADSTVKIWNPSWSNEIEWTLLQTYSGHFFWVFGLEYINKETMSSGSVDQTIHIWNINSNVTIRKINTGSAVYALKVFDNGAYLASGLGSGRINIYEIKNGGGLKSILNGHTLRVYDLALINIDLLVSSSGDCTIGIWNLTTNSNKFMLKGHSSPVYALRVINFDCVASGSQDSTLKLWNTTNGILIRTLSNHTNWIAYSVDVFNEDLVVSGSYDLKVNIWNSTSGHVVNTINTKLVINALVVLNARISTTTYSKLESTAMPTLNSTNNLTEQSQTQVDPTFTSKLDTTSSSISFYSKTLEFVSKLDLSASPSLASIYSLEPVYKRESTFSSTLKPGATSLFDISKTSTSRTLSSTVTSTTLNSKFIFAPTTTPVFSSITETSSNNLDTTSSISIFSAIPSPVDSIFSTKLDFLVITKSTPIYSSNAKSTLESVFTSTIIETTSTSLLDRLDLSTDSSLYSTVSTSTTPVFSSITETSSYTLDITSGISFHLTEFSSTPTTTLESTTLGSKLDLSFISTLPFTTSVTTSTEIGLQSVTNIETSTITIKKTSLTDTSSAIFPFYSTQKVITDNDDDDYKYRTNFHKTSTGKNDLNSNLMTSNSNFSATYLYTQASTSSTPHSFLTSITTNVLEIVTKSNPTFDPLRNLSLSQMQKILELFQTPNLDLNACLINCSNNGKCHLDSQTQQYLCKCISTNMNKLCQINEGVCAQSHKCLNGGFLLNNSCSCQCPDNGLYYGKNCELKRNICENRTCSFNGYCTQIQNETRCKCINGYGGETCQIESFSLKLHKSVQSTSTIISCIFICLFWILIFASDLMNYFKMGNENGRFDMNEWRFEKHHGFKRFTLNKGFKLKHSHK